MSSDDESDVPEHIKFQADDGMKSRVHSSGIKDPVQTVETSVRVPSRRLSAIVEVEALEATEHDDEESSELSIIDESATDLFGLTYFQASLFATVLEDAITQLRILAVCNSEIRVQKVNSEFNLLKALKYGVEQTVITNELIVINPYDLNKLEYKLKKLETDRKFLTELLEVTYVSLLSRGTFAKISYSVEHTASKDKRFAHLVENEARNKMKARMLAKQLRQQRNRCKRIQCDADIKIDALKSAIEDTDLNFEVTDRYVKNWQGARTECHELVIAQKEDTDLNSIEYYKRRTDHEQRVHSEAELLTNILIQETLERVEEWMNKFEVDMEAIDLKIQVKRIDWQNMYDKRVYLEEKYARHDVEMKAWLLFKEQRTKEREFHDTMTNSALIVQAWWRGILVRRELGPYRPKKRKPTGKKDKK